MSLVSIKYYFWSSLYMHYLYSITQGSDVIKRIQDNGSNNTALIDKVCAPVLATPCN